MEERRERNGEQQRSNAEFGMRPAVAHGLNNARPDKTGRGTCAAARPVPMRNSERGRPRGCRALTLQTIHTAMA